MFDDHSIILSGGAKKLRNFISEETFTLLSKLDIEWKNLAQGCIYKMENRDYKDTRVGKLVNSDGIGVSVQLPESVMKKLLSITDRNVTLYLKPYGEVVRIATVRRRVCPECDEGFASPHTLWVHRKKHCRVKDVPASEPILHQGLSESQ